MKRQKEDDRLSGYIMDESSVPDPGDIPGGVLHGGEDMLDSIYFAWREKMIGQKMQEWMKTKHKISFP